MRLLSQEECRLQKQAAQPVACEPVAVRSTVRRAPAVEGVAYSLEELHRAEADLERLQGAERLEACRRVARMGLEMDALLVVEHVIATLWASDELPVEIRGRFIERMAQVDGLKAESWLRGWFDEAELGGIPRPGSAVLASVCRALLRSKLSCFKAEHWMELALEKGIRLDITEWRQIQQSISRLKKGRIPYLLQSRVAKCLEADHMDLAEEWARLSLASPEGGLLAGSTVMTAWGRRGQADQAVQWLERMQKASIQLDERCFLGCIDACAKRGDVAGASELLARMDVSELRPNEYIYSSVINACAEAGATRSARSWMAVAREEGALNLVCYNALVKSYAKARQTEQACLTLRDMAREGVQADATSFNSAIYACAGAAPSVSRAQGLWRLMRESRTEATLVTFKSLMDVAAKGGDVRSAEAWYAEMLDAGLTGDAQTWRILMNASASAGEVERAEWWFQVARRAGCEMDEAGTWGRWGVRSRGRWRST